MALSLALVAAACGDDDNETEDTSSETSSGTDETTDDTGGSDEPLKVAFVYVGPVGDAGWTKKHDDGRQALEAEFGDKVEVTFLETVPENDEQPFETLVDEGNQLIFGTSFGYMEPMLAVAEANPDVCFEHATGYQTAENMGTYFGAAEEARYLSGIAAGHATENGQIGYVAAFPIPEVLRGINAFTLGAQSVNPDATVQVVWTSTWFDPEVEKQAAESLTAEGVDVLAMHQDTPSTGEAAAEAGAKWLGYNDDMSSFQPEAWLTGPVWDWAPYYIETTRRLLEDGECRNDQYYGTMADGMVGLAPYGESVSADVQAEIDAAAEEIKAGTLKPFTGPINNQAGEEVVADGETPDLGTLLGMDYLVEGVIGEIPES
jgi:basic membrane protein A and related proteins